MTHGLDAPLCALHFFDEEDGSDFRWLKPIVGIFDVWCLFEVSSLSTGGLPVLEFMTQGLPEVPSSSCNFIAFFCNVSS